MVDQMAGLVILFFFETATVPPSDAPNPSGRYTGKTFVLQFSLLPIIPAGFAMPLTDSLTSII
jgi:hypothetical protein